ncbi:hypothetical protein Enr10x_28390 [Gimesia panareensis]|uniref:Uncharacterized protein n=1 Tax=Gimesia panareensis TaxID=2527978 RepID=A0A517Q7B6_9PLAN|nr:hypothetical protein Enr10x_28390 [Gimesia panareensis]
MLELKTGRTIANLRILLNCALYIQSRTPLKEIPPIFS